MGVVGLETHVHNFNLVKNPLEEKCHSDECQEKMDVPSQGPNWIKFSPIYAQF